jgi:pimeloyl-ACP methyl ester carboxylesterase
MKLLASILLVITATLVLATAGFVIVAFAREQQPADALAPDNGRFVDTAEGRIFVTLAGPADGPPIIMTHGVAAWGGLWTDTTAALAARGYRVHAVDLPPFGFSDRPASGDYSRAAQARRLVALVDSLGLKQPTMIGHSYGGGPAMEAVLQAPERFGRIVLVAPVLGIGEPAKLPPMPLRLAPLREAFVAMTATNLLATRPLLASFMHRKDRALDRYVTIVQRPLTRARTTPAMADWLPVLLSGDPTALSAQPGSYIGLRVPMGLIWGIEDSVTPIAQGRALQRRVAGASLTILPNIGHMPQLEDPAAFLAALLPLLPPAQMQSNSEPERSNGKISSAAKLS